MHSQEMKEWYGGSDSEYDVPIEELRERRRWKKTAVWASDKTKFGERLLFGD